MHTSLAIDHAFTQGWFENISDDGTVTVNNDYILRTTGLTAGAAQKKHVVHLRGGDEIIFDVLARNIAGIGYAFLDSAGAGTNLNRVPILERDWRRYTIKQAVSSSEEFTQVVCGLGIFHSTNGDCEFRDPRILINSRDGFKRVYAQGMIEITNTEQTLYGDFHQMGVERIERESSTSISIYYKRKNWFNNKRPLVFCQLGTESANRYIAKAGNINAERFYIRVYDMVTGENVDLSSLGSTALYVAFSVEG